MIIDNPHYWVVMPAAGAGSRMGADIAKQYLPLLDKTVIEWSLSLFLNDARFVGIVVVLAADDVHWQTLSIAKHPKIRVVKGGAQRADSVRAGLSSLIGHAHADDWVLVHDAARPCLHQADLDKLIATLTVDPELAGGLLATPITDTLKQADAQQRVVNTVPRNDLWRALTPQMFRCDVLQRALTGALNHRFNITDEAAAVEAMGFKPRLIAGRVDNIKITTPEDMALATSILTAQQREAV